MEYKQKQINKIGKSALKAGFWYTISNIITKAILVISTPIFTKIMTPNDYGITATFTSWYGLLLTFCTLNLPNSIGRAKIDFPNRLNEYVGSIQITSFIASAIFGLICFIFIKPISSIFELPVVVVFILAIYLLFAPTISIYQSKFKYQYRYKENIFITLYTCLSSVILSLIFVLNIQDNRYHGRILGIVLPVVILSIALWINAINNKWIKFNPVYVKYGLKISTPLVLNGISLSVLSQSDRVIITKFCGTGMTAIYTVAYQFSILVSLILESIGQAWLPLFHDTYALGDCERIRKNLKLLIIFGCYIGLGCVAVAPEAIWILGGDRYQAGMWAVAPITLGLVCKFIYANYEHVELHLKKTHYIGIGTVIAAILNVVLNLIFVPKYGFVAAAYTTLLSYLVLMFIHYYITKYILKVDIYDNLFMFLALGVELIISIIMLMLYPFIWLRYLLMIIITGIIFYKYRIIILPFLRKMLKFKTISRKD